MLNKVFFTNPKAQKLVFYAVVIEVDNGTGKMNYLGTKHCA